MPLSWIAEQPALWDADKARLIGQSPAGIFDLRFQQREAGDLLPGDWWRAADEKGRTLGYGWMDVVWGDAEILLVTAPDARGRGVGSFILEQLVAMARERGLHRVYNTVRPTHPQGAAISAWLVERGFRSAEDGTLGRSIT